MWLGSIMLLSVYDGRLELNALLDICYCLMQNGIFQRSDTLLVGRQELSGLYKK